MPICNNLYTQHQPTKLSTKTIQPTTKTAQFTQEIAYTGAQGLIHQAPNTNLNILSNVPKFCFMVVHLFGLYFFINSELLTTDTELNAIAAPAITGLNSQPVKG